MTNAERLRHNCPKCNAPAGSPCIDFTRTPTPRPHKTRGPGQLEKHVAERIARKTTREKASYGPLFQDLADAEVKVPTVAEEQLRDRMAHARSFDDMGGPDGCRLIDMANRGMQYLWIHEMFREIGRRAGENWERAIFATCTYGFGNGIEYVPDRLREFMTTTKPYTFAYFRIPDETSTIKVRLVPALTWAPTEPLMTVEEFESRFKKPDHRRGLKDAPEPDDGGLFERVMAALAS